MRTLTSKPEPAEIPEDDPDAMEDQPKPTVLTTHPGINRVAWDLCYAGAVFIPKVKIDGGDPKVGPLANPGTYTLNLMVDGKKCTAKVEIRPDSRVHVSASDLEEQLRFALALRDDISRVTKIVNRLRTIRKQLTARADWLKDDPKAASLLQSSKEVIGKLDSLEARLHNPKAEVTYDILAQRGGAQLYSRLIFLFDFLKDSDGAPTQGMREVYDEQHRELGKLETQFHGLVTGDLAKLTDIMGHPLKRSPR